MSVALAVTAALAVGLLAATLGLAAMMLRQSSTLEANVATTAEIVNANVRTLSQVQRELLRLSLALEDPSTPAEDLDLHRAFVTQRMGEASLSYQRQTLGTDDLLAEARSLSRRWDLDVEPRVTAIIDDSPGADQLRPDVLDELARLELGFNDLVAKGEVNRKMRAGEANAATIGLLDNARGLVIGLVTTFLGFSGVVVVALIGYRRLDRQRESSRQHLLELNVDLRKLSEVASRTGNPVVITDARGDVEWVNEAFTRVTGYALDEVLGRQPGEVLQGPDTDAETVAMMRSRIDAGEGFTCEVVNYAKSGRRYWISMEVCPVRDEDGRLTNFIAIESDVTEAREFEQHLMRAKEAAEDLAEQKAQFLASMSHEIRTPLNAVIGLTDLLLGTDLTLGQREYVQLAHRSGTLLLSTISNILSFSAAESGRIELESRPFSPARTMARSASLVQPLADRRGLRVAVEVDAGVPEVVVGDEARLQQVLVNLLGNAVKFTSTGTITARVTAEGAADGLTHLGFCVSDTGIGIPADRLDRLFEPFTQGDTSTTRQYGGTGLGLAICHRLVDLLGGEIAVQSTVGVGSSFSFVVPLPAGLPIDLADDTSSPSAPDDVEPSPLRVLVAEDDGVNQMVAVHMLQRLGHAVDVVDDGVEALEAMRHASYDVVLLDVQMPRLDGLGVARQVREEWPQDRRPVLVALTANALDGDRERFLSAGMDLYLSKPFRLEQLDALLREVGAGRRVAREPSFLGSVR